MENLKKIKSIMETSKKMKSDLENWSKIISDARCDKNGMGFNRDSRFSGIKINLSIDSWKGYYGSSGSSTYLIINNKTEFHEAFLKALNNNFEKIMFETCDIMNENAKRYIDNARKEINDSLKILNEIQDI